MKETKRIQNKFNFNETRRNCRQRERVCFERAKIAAMLWIYCLLFVFFLNCFWRLIFVCMRVCFLRFHMPQCFALELASARTHNCSEWVCILKLVQSKLFVKLWRIIIEMACAFRCAFCRSRKYRLFIDEFKQYFNYMITINII